MAALFICPIGVLFVRNNERLYPGVSIHHTDMGFRSEFSPGVCLSPDDGPYPMLTDIDDLVWDTVRSVFIHEQLLFIECCQNVQQIVYRLIKLCTFVPYETDDVAEIPFDIPKLLSDAFANGSVLFLLLERFR